MIAAKLTAGPAARCDLAVGCVTTPECDCGCPELLHIKENGLDVTAQNLDTNADSEESERTVHMCWDDRHVDVEKKIARAFDIPDCKFERDEYDDVVTERDPHLETTPDVCELQQVLLGSCGNRITFRQPECWRLSPEERQEKIEEAKYMCVGPRGRKRMYEQYLAGGQYQEDYNNQRLRPHEQRIVEEEKRAAQNKRARRNTDPIMDAMDWQADQHDDDPHAMYLYDPYDHDPYDP